MTTLDEKPQADIDSLVTAPPGETLDCAQCGRNCKHTPNAGGGTSGSEKGEKYTPTARSESRCPACDGKPHRKEGRIYQIIACYHRQAMKKLGSTALLEPNEAIYLKMAEMARDNEFVKVPTEREINAIVREKLGLPPIEPKKRTKNTSDPVPQTKEKDEVANAASEIIPDAAINLDSIDLPVPTVIKEAIKKKEQKTPEQKEAEKEARKAEKKAKRQAEKEAKAAAGESTKRRAKGSDAADAAAEKTDTDDTRPLNSDEIEIDPDVTGEDGYNPFAGVGMPVVEDDDDDEELTEAQQASLAKLTR